MSPLVLPVRSLDPSTAGPTGLLGSSGPGDRRLVIGRHRDGRLIYAMAGGAAPGTATFPARSFMRPIGINLGSQTFAYGGQPVTFQLRNLGYLDSLLVHLQGTYTVATAALVFNQMQPYNSVANFLIQGPNSPLPPFNIGGQNLHIWNLRSDDVAPYVKGFRTPASDTLDANAFWASKVDQFPSAIGAAVAHLWWVLPFHRTVLDITGTLPMGNSQIVNLIISPAAVADLVTTAADFTAPAFTVEVEQVYLTPPPAGAAITGGRVPSNFAIAYDETYQAIAQVGLQKVTVVPNYTILGILHGVALNGAMDSADLQALNLRIGSSWWFEPPGIGPGMLSALQAARYGQPLPVGFFLYDQDVLGSADWIHTENGQVTEIESDLTVAAGATLGTNPRVYTSTRRLIALQGV